LRIKEQETRLIIPEHDDDDNDDDDDELPHTETENFFLIKSVNNVF